MVRFNGREISSNSEMHLSNELFVELLRALCENGQYETALEKFRGKVATICSDSSESAPIPLTLVQPLLHSIIAGKQWSLVFKLLDIVWASYSSRDDSIELLVEDGDGEAEKYDRDPSAREKGLCL